MNRKRGRQLVQHVNAGIFCQPLDAANIGPVDTRIGRQPLLCEASVDPQIPKIDCKYVSRAHGTTRPFDGPLIHGL